MKKLDNIQLLKDNSCNAAINRISDSSIELLQETKIGALPVKQQIDITELFLTEIGIIYFLADINRNYVRIGKTKNLANLYERFRKHQSGSPIELVLDGILIDRDYHKLDKRLRQQFKNFRHHSDWFLYMGDIKSFVRDNCLKIEYRNTYFQKRNIEIV